MSSGIKGLCGVFHKDAAWEVCVDFERLCEEHVRSYARSVERKCSAMREMVGGAEKAGVDWTDVRLRRLKHQVSELRRLEDKLNLLSLVEDPIQFVQVTRGLQTTVCDSFLCTSGFQKFAFFVPCRV